MFDEGSISGMNWIAGAMVRRNRDYKDSEIESRPDRLAWSIVNPILMSFI